MLGADGGSEGGMRATGSAMRRAFIAHDLHLREEESLAAHLA